VAWLIVVSVCYGSWWSNSAALAEKPPDLSKIDRHIAKTPAFISDRPLYGLYVFGPSAQMHVWAILDKSKPDAPEYDLLYFDRNADGDLTGSDERIAGK